MIRHAANPSNLSVEPGPSLLLARILLIIINKSHFLQRSEYRRKRVRSKRPTTLPLAPGTFSYQPPRCGCGAPRSPRIPMTHPFFVRFDGSRRRLFLKRHSRSQSTASHAFHRRCSAGFNCVRLAARRVQQRRRSERSSKMRARKRTGGNRIRRQRKTSPSRYSTTPSSGPSSATPIGSSAP